MSIFNPYLNVIKEAVSKDPKASGLIRNNENDTNLDYSYIVDLKNKFNKEIQLNKTQEINSSQYNLNTDSLPSLGLGSHPDFEHLRGTTNTEYHWIITGFVDVKKSTQLFNKFSLPTAALITEAIVKASIYAVSICDGYIHRIQGDGLMVYFGGKNMDKSKATKNALKAFAMISYFVKEDLKDYFETNGIKDIYTRAGLDLGDKQKVLWLYSGLGSAGEITTNSLHTSLVPKMQAKAKNNGIVVGKNITSQISSQSYFTKKHTPIWKYEDGQTYDHFDFDWEKYLIETNEAVQNGNGKLILIPKKTPVKGDLDALYGIAKNNKPFFNN